MTPSKIYKLSRLPHAAVSITNGKCMIDRYYWNSWEILASIVCVGKLSFRKKNPFSVFAPVFTFTPAAARTLNFFGPCDSQVWLFSKRSVAVDFASFCNDYKSCKYNMGPIWNCNECYRSYCYCKNGFETYHSLRRARWTLSAFLIQNPLWKSFETQC